MKHLFILLLCCTITNVSLANEAMDEAAIDAALNAVVAVGEQMTEDAPAASSLPPVAAPIIATPVSKLSALPDIVQVNRSELNTWMQQQQIQANVITNQANNQLWTTTLLAAVWLITFIMLLQFMRREGCKEYVNIIGLNLIIFATVFMVLVVETDQQLTAGAGILGAIAGYIFRAMQSEQPGESKS
ncbi:MAG: hypothetical protein Q9M09_03420 [Mariprofundaceae bacterium]|nr:hypothetical protein [Mariprofundaceae bacterium]